MTPDDLANLRLVARVLDGVAYGAMLDQFLFGS